MNKKVKNSNMDQLMEAIVSLQNKDEAYKLFADLCTVKELEAINQRFLVAGMLKTDKTYLEIAEATGASTATISRVNRSFSYGEGGYDLVMERINMI